MKKGIVLNVDYEPYYGINVNIWGTEDNKDDRKTFIQKIFRTLKDDWINKNVNIANWLDFINTLNNGLNGKELFENVVCNCLYIEELERKAYEIGISLDCIRENRHSYSQSEEITIYGKLTPLLEKTEEFKKWFLYELHKKDEKIYCILFDDSESKKSLISKLEKQIENEESTKKYYENSIDKVNERISELKKELEKIKK